MCSMYLPIICFALYEPNDLEIKGLCTMKCSVIFEILKVVNYVLRATHSFIYSHITLT